MKEKITITLKKNTDVLEEYEKNDRNMLKVAINLPDGRLVESPEYRVELVLTRDAMIGLGTELLRTAHTIENEGGLEHWHLDPIRAGGASQGMGVYIHPSSCELIIGVSNLGTVEEAIRHIESGEV